MRTLALASCLLICFPAFASNNIASALGEGLVGMAKGVVSPYSVRFSPRPAGTLSASLEGKVVTRNHAPNGALIQKISLSFECMNRQTSVSLFVGLDLFANTPSALGKEPKINIRFGRDVDNATWVMPATKSGSYQWKFPANRPEIIGALFGAKKLVGTAFDTDGKPMRFEFDTSGVRAELQKKDFFCKDVWLAAFDKYGAKAPTP